MYLEYAIMRCFATTMLFMFHRIVCSLSFHSAAFEYLFRDGGAELVWGRRWRGWVQVEPRVHRAATVSPFSPAIDRSFSLALLATI